MQRSKLNLFVVDDDVDVRRSLALLLLPQGHAVQAFESGEAFLAGVDAQQCGCVILDLRMEPGLSGVEVFEQLRARRSPLVVLFLSGHGDIATAIEQHRLGAHDWVEKPHTAQLQAKLGPALAQAEVRAMAMMCWRLLTPREREASPLIASGRTSKEAAREMVPACDHRTFENYRAQVFAKLEVGHAADLRGWMAAQHWLTGFDG